jgi:hypothetical protein
MAIPDLIGQIRNRKTDESCIQIFQRLNHLVVRCAFFFWESLKLCRFWICTLRSKYWFGIVLEIFHWVPLPSLDFRFMDNVTGYLWISLGFQRGPNLSDDVNNTKFFSCRDHSGEYVGLTLIPIGEDPILIGFRKKLDLTLRRRVVSRRGVYLVPFDGATVSDSQASLPIR